MGESSICCEAKASGGVKDTGETTVRGADQQQQQVIRVLLARRRLQA